MFGTLKHAFKKFQAEEMTDHAAALTYFVMMSLFPALLVGVALLGLLGDADLVTDAVEYARDKGAPAEVADALKLSLSTTVEKAGGAVSVALVFGVAVALFGASGAFGAAGRALNVVAGVQETRGFIRHKLSDLAWTTVVIVLALVALLSILLGGGLASSVFDTIGLGDTAAEIWRFARWLVAIGAVLSIYAIVFAYAPNITPRRRHLLTPGALTGVLIWIAASIGFSFYVSKFGNYGATYGVFAGAVILLLWLYISSIAFLFGAELNAVVDNARTVSRGGPPAPSPPPSAASSNGQVDGYGRDALAPPRA